MLQYILHPINTIMQRKKSVNHSFNYIHLIHLLHRHPSLIYPVLLLEFLYHKHCTVHGKWYRSFLMSASTSKRAQHPYSKNLKKTVIEQVHKKSVFKTVFLPYPDSQC